MRSAIRPQRGWLVGGVLSGLAWTAAKITIPLLAAAAIDDGIIPGDAAAIGLYAGLIVVVGVVQAVFTGLRRYAAFRIAYRVETDLRQRLFAHLQRLALRVPRPGADRPAHGARQHRHPAGEPGRRAHPADRRERVHPHRRRHRDDAQERHARAPRPRRAPAAQPRGGAVLAADHAGVPRAPAGARRPVGRRRGERGRRPRREGLRLGAHAAGPARRRGRHGPRPGDGIARLPRGVPAAHRLPARDRARRDPLVRRAPRARRQAPDRRPRRVQLLHPDAHLAAADGGDARRAGGARRRVGRAHPRGPLDRDGRGRARPAGRAAGRRSRRGPVRRRPLLATAPGPPVLDGLDLHVGGGEAVAIVGPTASGKTTVARLLPRFYDVDRGSGRPRRRRRARRRGSTSCAAASASCSRTRSCSPTPCTENIAFADPEAPLDDVRRAARLAGAADFVDELPRATTP